MEKEKDRLIRQLEEELKHVTFNKHQEVLARTHPLSWREKLKSFWNKEVEIPLIPVGGFLTLFLFLWGISTYDHEQDQVEIAQRELVEVGGNTYWKDELEKVVVRHED